MKKVLYIGLLLVLAFILVACSGRKVQITFNTDGGTSVEKISVGQLKAFDEPTTTKTGHTFLGWFRDAEFTQEFDFNVGASRNLTLYAKWEINSYTLTLNFNNGEDNQTITDIYNTNITLPTPTRVGFTFGGWYTNSNLTNVFTGTRMPAANTMLYARWAAIVYIVTFTVDGVTLTTREVEHGQSITNIPTVPTKVGYDGVWSTTNFTNITDDLEVEAIYTKKIYQVQFKDVDGNIYGTLNVEHGDTIQRPVNDPVRIGYDFISYNFNFDDPVVGNTIIDVIFNPIMFEVTFYGFDGVRIETLNVQYGNSAVAPIAPEVTGYTFVEWDKTFDNVTSILVVNAIYQKNSYNLTVNAEEGIFLDETKVKVIEYEYLEMITAPEIPTRIGYNFAKWVDVNGVEITFPRSMNSVDGIEIFAIYSVIIFNTSYNNLFGTNTSNPNTYNIETPTITLSNPTSRVGYTFEGWFTELIGGVEKTEITLGTTGNITLYARWEAVTYNIAYNNLQGTTQTNPTTYNIETATITLTDPTNRTGYTFVGWFSALSGGTEVTSIALGSINNRTIYARWQAISYDITYENLQGTTQTNPTLYNIETATITLANPTNRIGYTFEGWFTELIGGVETTEIALGTTGNIMLYARWEVIIYDINYENLVDSTTTNPDKYNIETATITLTDPTNRTGYTFVGWFDAVTGGTVVTEITLGSIGNRTIYARWEVITYDITYENLLESTTTTNPTEYNIETATITLTSPTARTHYNFVGWFTEEVGGTQVTQITTGTTEDITLYARWIEKEYTITFVIDGTESTINVSYLTLLIIDDIPVITPKAHYDQVAAAWDMDPINHQVVGNHTFTVEYTPNIYVITFESNLGSIVNSIDGEYNTSITMPINPTRDGYTFAGWFTDDITFVNGFMDTNFQQTVTVYAKWTEYPVITFNSNGGVTPAPISEAAGTPISEPDEPTRTGYTFDAWYTDNGTFLNEYVFDVMPNSDLTLYAKWSLFSYTVTYENIFGIENTNPTTYNIETPITLTSLSDRDHYTFDGWYDAPTEGTLVTQISGTGNKVVYARWQAISYNITYENLQGTTQTNPTLYNIETATITLTDPTNRTGYDFVGWFSALSGGVERTEITLGTTGNITLYARWEVVTYSIAYNNLQGTTQTNPTLYNIETPTITLANPTNRIGYTFEGWFTELIGGVETTEIELGTTGNITLYARWEVITYNINYENLLDSTTTNPNEYNIETATITLTSPTARTHYNFVGWFTEEVGGTQVTQITTGTTEDITLYARWIEKEYIITFDIDGTETTIDVSYLTILTIADIPVITPKAHYDQVAAAWNLSPIGYEVIGNHTFIVVYTPNIYVITFDVNNGIPMAPLNVTYGVTPTINDPVRNGYTFNAWYTDFELIDLFDINDEITGNFTLYATYEINYYDINIDVIFEKEDLDDSNIVTLDSTSQFTIFNSLYGTEISPIRNYEGYVFHHFIYDSITYISIDDLIEVTRNVTGLETVEVYYRKIVITITFYQDQSLFPEGVDPTEAFRIYFNESFDIGDAPELAPAVGYSVYWNRTVFDNVRQNIDVYALYYQTGVKTIAFNDRGTIRFLVSYQGADLALGNNAPIWVLSRSGYKFVGWFTEEVGGTKVNQGNLLFSDFINQQTVLYARWDTLTPFNKPTNIVIDVDLETENITISWTLNPEIIEGQQPKEFSIVLNNVEIIVPIASVTLTGTTYQLALTTASPLHDDFEVLLGVGKHELTVQAIGDEINHYHGLVSDVKTHSNDSIFDDDPTDIAVYDYFIVEDFGGVKRYVFYSNLTYVFGSTYSFEIITGHEFASVDGNKIITKNTYGSFRFRMIRTGYDTVVYDALVIPDVRGFSIGSNYQTYLNASSPSSTFLDKTLDPYYVGTENNFYLDIRILNNQGSRIPLASVELDYELYEVISGVPNLINKLDWNDYITFHQGNQFRMKAATVGSTFEIKVKPKYQSTQMTTDTLTYRFTVNDGHNAFTNQQLKSLFANFDVEKINIHANIEAALLANQLNADGSPRNYPSSVNPNNGDVYLRYAPSVTNDNITIEGNYMTIDGSNLPYSNKNSGSGLVGFAQAFEVIGVQVAIFSYNVGGSVSDNEFRMNNLQIIGNTTVPSINFSGTAEEILQQEQLMSRNSGGYLGIYTVAGETYYTNVSIGYTVIAIMHNSYGTKTDGTTPILPGQMDYVKIYDTWANSIYTRGAIGIDLKNSHIGQSGGPAIHAIDIRIGGGINNPEIIIQNTTSVDNWVSGEEAWFKAYGMSPLALGLKAGVEGGIASTQRSIITEIVNPVTGLPSEMINAILLTEQSEDANTYSDPEEEDQTGGSEVRFIIGDETGSYPIERPWNYLSTADPRIATTGPNPGDKQFGFPIGTYSNLASYISLKSAIFDTAAYIGNPVTEIEAFNLASLAAFYNLDAIQVLNVYGAVLDPGVPLTTFIGAINYLYPGHEFPRYMEVLAPVPVFDGFSTIIIELKDLN